MAGEGVMSAEGIVHCDGPDNQPLCFLRFKIEGARALYSCSKLAAPSSFHCTISNLHKSLHLHFSRINPPATDVLYSTLPSQQFTSVLEATPLAVCPVLFILSSTLLLRRGASNPTD